MIMPRDAPRSLDSVLEMSGNHGDIISLYFRDVSRYPLLTREEEVDLFKKLEEGTIYEIIKLGERKYKIAPVSLNEEGRDAKEKLIKHNLRLVVSIAKKFLNRGLSFMDLIEEGNLGIMKAIDKFDYRRGCKFSTYATYAIKTGIQRAIGNFGNIIRVNSAISDEALDIKRESEREYLSFEQVCKERRMSPQRTRTLVKAINAQEVFSMQEDSNKEFNYLSYEENDGKDFELLSQDDVYLYIDRLDNSRMKDILVLRYFGGETLDKVGRHYGITRERVRQIEVKAIKSIRKMAGITV